ncbi:Mur ligase family protein [Chamaesiphon minutus]|uniref:UDP-N-acetylmuramyl pentapeptide synthase n=1 Tax=Chamaesiphon minutus (strain ATCC 27169 / PCC 6605) TaxID=1173020 RepID=K9UJD6_CHAP6|nr:UDP-N-acetylmuramoyl-tripeptide--D-alanyl-D-alanine ligase [Chamaesiphon minutus]AFY94758.1 UDP-N-acetylmuramyl pentapeptide synthase [Chamaesiphon minutus PCC 6605]
MLTLICLTIISAATILFFTRRGLRYLRYFQQEEYNGTRFKAWFLEKRTFDTKGTLIALIAAALSLFATGGDMFVCVAICAGAAATLVFLGFQEEDPRKVGKIKLNMTDRATAIYNLALALYSIATLLIVTGTYFLGAGDSIYIYWFIAIALIQSSPIWIVIANAMLWPNEYKKQQAFRQEAKDILADYQPYTIGITGSYGKTSTKAILGSILEAIEPTFWTPGSINTEMGITRQIREQLKPQQQIAIIEMGAYQIGSIAKLCRFTPPKAGLVTAVGVMHLERFGGAENIYKAKCELAQAIPTDGLLVCNGDNPGARKMAEEYPKATTLLYGLEPELGHLDCWMSDIQAGMDGTTFNIHWQGKEYPGFTKLLGAPMLSNLVGSFTMACALGKDPDYVIAAIHNLEPANNRLNLRKNGDGFILDDSYNSNPIGFASALEVLEALEGGRKILMTPGMVELGEIQAAENRQVALKAASICDLALVIGDTNKDALKAGLLEGGLAPDKLMEFADRDLALAYLTSPEHRQPKDTILIENDLPDLYEAISRF